MEIVAVAVAVVFGWCGMLVGALAIWMSVMEFKLRDFSWVPAAGHAMAAGLLGLSSLLWYGLDARDSFSWWLALTAAALLLCVIESMMAAYGSQIFPVRTDSEEG